MKNNNMRNEIANMIRDIRRSPEFLHGWQQACTHRFVNQRIGRSFVTKYDLLEIEGTNAERVDQLITEWSLKHGVPKSEVSMCTVPPCSDYGRDSIEISAVVLEDDVAYYTRLNSLYRDWEYERTSSKTARELIGGQWQYEVRGNRCVLYSTGGTAHVELTMFGDFRNMAGREAMLVANYIIDALNNASIDQDS